MTLQTREAALFGDAQELRLAGLDVLRHRHAEADVHARAGRLLGHHPVGVRMLLQRRVDDLRFLRRDSLLSVDMVGEGD